MDELPPSSEDFLKNIKENIGETSKQTKLEMFDRYTDELQANTDLLTRIIETYIIFLKHQKIDISSLNDFPFIEYRISNFLVSVTDDLIRYASYHKVGIEERESGAKIYSISEPARASFFIKWILKLKLCQTDNILDKDPYKSIKYEESDELPSTKARLINYCNETLSLISISIIFGITYADKKNTPVFYNEFFNNKEVMVLYYAMRYRSYHQDSYTTLLYKLKDHLKRKPIYKNI